MLTFHMFLQKPLKYGFQFGKAETKCNAARQSAASTWCVSVDPLMSFKQPLAIMLDISVFTIYNISVSWSFLAEIRKKCPLIISPPLILGRTAYSLSAYCDFRNFHCLPLLLNSSSSRDNPKINFKPWAYSVGCSFQILHMHFDKTHIPKYLEKIKVIDLTLIQLV